MAEKDKTETPAEKPAAKAAAPPKPTKAAAEWKKEFGTPLHVFAGAMVRARIKPEQLCTQAEYERAVQGFLKARPDGRR